MWERVLVWLKLPLNIFRYFQYEYRKFKLKRLAKNYRKDGEVVYPVADRYKKLNKIAKKVFKMTSTHIEIIGEENIPDKAVLFTPNHRSSADPLVMMRVINKLEKVKPYPIFVAKKELEKSKFGPALFISDSLFLDRDNIRQALKLFQMGSNFIRNGRSVVVFPEGTRNTTRYGITDFKPGAFKMAYQSHCPIVPVTIIGSEVPFKRYILSSKNTVKVIFHKPIQPLSFINIDSKQLAQRVEKIVFAGYKQYVPYADENGVFEEEIVLHEQLQSKLKDLHPKMESPEESMEISVEKIMPIVEKKKRKAAKKAKKEKK